MQVPRGFESLPFRQISVTIMPKKILVIEDDKTIQLLLKVVLERGGYQVSSALDGMQGLMLARSTKPDLIILDMMMPAGGGSSLLTRVRQMTDTFAIPIVVYSSLAEDEVKKQLSTTENITILGKTTPPAELLAAVQRIMPNN